MEISGAKYDTNLTYKGKKKLGVNAGIMSNFPSQMYRIYIVEQLNTTFQAT